MSDQSDDNPLMTLTTTLVSAYVSNNPVPMSELPSLISEVHRAFSDMSKQTDGPEASAEPLKPAVSVKRSVTPDYLICLEDGKQFKSLKRHIYTHYGLSPNEYRVKWGLPADYPMVAPNYAAARSNLAKTMGLGRKKSCVRRGASGQARSQEELIEKLAVPRWLCSSAFDIGRAAA